MRKAKYDRLCDFRFWMESTFSSEELSQTTIQKILDKINEEFR